MSHDVATVREVYRSSGELLSRVAHLLEGGLLHEARDDGASALGAAGWLLSGLSERLRAGEVVKLVLALTVLVEEDISSHSIRNGSRALHMGAQLIGSLSSSPGDAGEFYARIRDDIICWADHVEMGDFPHGNSGPEALRLAANLLKLTTCLT